LNATNCIGVVVTHFQFEVLAMKCNLNNNLTYGCASNEQRS